MTLSAVAATPTKAFPALLQLFPAPSEARSRPSSSWATQDKSPVLHTASEPPRTLVYVYFDPGLSALLTRSSSSIPDLLASLAPHMQAESRLTAMPPTHTALTETMPPLTKAMVPSTVKLLSSLSTASSPNLASLLETTFHVYEGDDWLKACRRFE
jgi:hypothetical protein